MISPISFSFSVRDSDNVNGAVSSDKLIVKGIFPEFETGIRISTDALNSSSPNSPLGISAAMVGLPTFKETGTVIEALFGSFVERDSSLV